MVKGLTLTGTEKKVEVSGGLHVFVMNFSTDTELLVSKTPNVVKGKEGTYVIAPKTGIMVQDACTMGTIEGVSDYRGELYAKGNGYVQFVPTNSLNFSVVGGGGDSSSPTPVIENPLHIKGIVATVEDLPTTGEVGDMYFVGNPDTDEDLAEYVYIGNKFEKLGTVSKDKDLVGILGKLVETVGYEHNSYIAPNGVTFANYKTFAYEEEIEPNLIIMVNGERTNLYSQGELTDAIAVTHFVNSNITIDSNVEDVYLIADYDVTSDTTSNEAVVGMTYVKLDEGEEVLEFVSLPLDLTDKSEGQRAGIKIPEDAIGIEENVVTLQVLGTGEFDINLRLNLIKVPKGTEINYDSYKWREPTWNVISSLNSIVSYMNDELPTEITDRVEANLGPRLEDLRTDVDTLIDDMSTKADRSEIIGENLIETPYVFLTKENSPVEQSGVTFTLNDDGTILIDGTNTSSGNLNLRLVNSFTMIAGVDYTLHDDVNIEGFRTRITESGTGTIIANDSYSSSQPEDRPVTFSVDTEKVGYIYISMASGCTADNVLYRPMLEFGSIAHEYQPYNLSRYSLRGDIDSIKEKGTTLERVQNTTRVITAPEKSTFASISKIEGKTIRYTTSLDSAPVNSIVSRNKNYTPVENKIEGKGYSSSGELVDNTNSLAYATVDITKGETYTIFGLKPSSALRVVQWEDTTLKESKAYTSNSKGCYTFTAIGNKFAMNALYSNIDSEVITVEGTTIKECTISLTELTKNLPDYGVEGNILDLENMKYYHNSTVVNLEDATWSLLSSPGGVIFKSTTFKPVKENPSVFMCMRYEYVENYDMFYETPMNAVSTTIGNIYIRDRLCSTLSELQEVIKGIKIAYELETPEVIDLKSIIPPIAVTPNGTLTFNNEHNLDIPTEVIYKKEG